MARISTYPYDLVVRDSDAWIGTEFPNKRTKQYTAKAVADYLNINGRVSIAGQINYKFVAKPADEFGTMAFPLGDGSGTLFSAITEFKISTLNVAGQNVFNYLNYLVGQEILIMSQASIQDFGHYKITSYLQDPLKTNFYNLQISFIGGNGNIFVDKYYDIVNFTFGEAAVTFEYTQVSPATTWNITHNLGRFPSITVIDTGDTVVTGEYTYIDNNNVTLNFSAGFAGKAYLN
tara:strand:- start:337 stop:1035 length:699 start_codon:yes stop_codon:yes gene_type:complete